MNVLLPKSESRRSRSDWKAVDLCRSCAHPNPQGAVRCGGCRRLNRFELKTVAPLLARRSGRWVKQGLELSVLCVLVFMALAIAVRLAPLLVVFPLVLLALPPSASRGGRTVVRQRSPEMVGQRLV